MKIGIYGYGNLGRGIESAVTLAPDMELAGIFTRRAPESLKTQTHTPVYCVEQLSEFEGVIDVLIICGGSATDLPEMTPRLAEKFNVVDSFDTHADIPVHFEKTDSSAKKGGNVALISAGWDPGLFSIARLYFSSILPNGSDYTFWGRGVSQGHSDAIRRLDGVVDARQYTVPVESAKNAIREGSTPTLSAREKHVRECYVVAKEGADKARIENEIKSMPNYFADYDTTVTFITAEEMAENHKSLPHGGNVIRIGKTGLEGESSHVAELSLKLDSNPQFTAQVLTAGARAIYRMAKRGMSGAVTMFDIAPRDLSFESSEALRAKLL